MSDLPEHVYLVTVDGEWPVSAIADCHPSTPDVVEAEVKRRTTGRNQQASGRAHVWRACLKDAVEMELVPSHRVDAVMQVKHD